MLKPIISRLRRVPDTLKMPDGNGGTLTFVSDGLCQGYCERCKRKFWVASKIGDLSCPHCSSPDNVTWQWARAHTVFLPEVDDG